MGRIEMLENFIVAECAREDKEFAGMTKEEQLEKVKVAYANDLLSVETYSEWLEATAKTNGYNEQ
jgi:hypothetical protein